MSPPPKLTSMRTLPITTQVRSLCRRLAAASENGAYCSSCGSTRQWRGARQPPKYEPPSSRSSVGADRKVVQNIISELHQESYQRSDTCMRRCRCVLSTLHACRSNWLFGGKTLPLNLSKLYITAGFYITIKASNNLLSISWGALRLWWGHASLHYITVWFHEPYSDENERCLVTVIN